MKRLETERLFFRGYEKSDKENFIGLFTDEAVMKYVGDGVLTLERAEAFWQKLFEKLYPDGYDIWAVFSKENSEYVGHAGIYRRPNHSDEWEFVYFLKREAWGKGYATEIARRLVRFGFEDLNLQEVFASVDDEHTASIGVLKKSGLKFKRYEYDENERFSVYSITAEDRE
jgi:Acetyltransferases, including N-acetylases of ribosomal proteins